LLLEVGVACDLLLELKVLPSQDGDDDEEGDGGDDDGAEVL